ncbi:glycosyltransferase [Bacteroides intestinalis]|uniref:glycosyltransferase n=1 Tax=Bacteroides intestinalis TaxID=329854 RepID=UPI0022E62277|nr:glycosyltransferase [Bacteroides intestinalis]
MNIPEPLVSISCITYNHARYIRQCLDGFVLQKTTFPFEVLIHDDASTDGTADIIREYEMKYPYIIKPIYEQENQWVKGRRGSAIFNFPRAKGKYIALCEGDDYWIDPLKLQKQVDILESDKNIGFVYSKFQLVNFDNMLIENYSTVSNQLSHSKTGYLLPSLLRNNFPQTLTVVFKKELLANFDKYYSYGYDWPLFIHICGKCKSVFLKDVTGCYRTNPNGMMASGTLKDVDNGGFTTLSGAFRAYLCGEYKVAPILDKLKINVYMYYRLSKGDIKDSVELENCVKSRLLYQLMRRMIFVWAFLLKKK